MPKTCSPILSRTTNFYRLYQHVCGQSEVPRIYHFWACIGMIAACLEDRCWCEIYKDEPLKPNLYICLVGPGSLGKGIAISHAVRLLESSVITPIYRGKITYAHLIDVLGKPHKDEWDRKILANPRIWLVMDELKNAVGSNRGLNEDFIALMTEIYTAANYTMRTGTRTHDEVALVEPCANWIFGSTEVWLRQVLTKDIFESGFVARVCTVFADYNLQKRVTKPCYPVDREEVYDHLRARLWAIQQVYKGPFIMTPSAECQFDSWYQTRKIPDDEALYSSWMRQKEILVRLAMINCVADGGPMVISQQHLVRASQMVNHLGKFTARLIESASENAESKPVNDVEKEIRKRGSISHSALLKKMRAKKGYTAKKLRDAVAGLEQEDLIGREFGPKRGVIYVWKASTTSQSTS